MVATGGFGALPNNPLTETFQNVIEENVPSEFLEPLNTYMDEISSPRISSDPDPDFQPSPPIDLVGAIENLFEADSTIPAEEPSLLEVTKAAVEGTQTRMASIQSAVPTATLTPTQLPATVPPPTFTVVPTLTPFNTPDLRLLTPVYYRPPLSITDVVTTVITPTPGVVLYFGGTSNGNIGSRSTMDSMCFANLPASFTAYRAFIGISAADSIANLPSNYGIPTNLPIGSTSNVILASNWADLMDGTINTNLDAAGVTLGFNSWWSGADNADGSHVDGGTDDCVDWSDNTNIVGGNYGIDLLSDASWMDVGYPAACDQILAVLCIAY